MKISKNKTLEFFQKDSKFTFLFLQKKLKDFAGVIKKNANFVRNFNFYAKINLHNEIAKKTKMLTKK